MNEKRMNELTINDIIRKVRERQEKLILMRNEPDAPTNVFSRVDELNQLLYYIEKDEEY